MKLKHYLGALLMAGSVVAVSFPADANPGIRFCQRFCQRYAPPLVKRYAPPLAKIIEKTISKPNINSISLIPRSQAKLINAELIKAKQITDKITIGSPPPVVVSPPPVVPTQPTGSEQEALKQDIFRSVVTPVGGTIAISGGTVVHLNSQNANSERTQIPVSRVKSIAIWLGNSIP